MDPRLVGGILGTVFGILGGLIGTYASIKNTAGPRERTFMIKVAIAFWIGASAFVVAMFLLRPPYIWFLWIPYGIALSLVIGWINRRQNAIRGEEEKNRSSTGS